MMLMIQHSNVHARRMPGLCFFYLIGLTSIERHVIFNRAGLTIRLARLKPEALEKIDPQKCKGKF